MHILYFHQHFSTPKGATGTRSYEMAKELISRGHRVTMICGSFEVGKTGLEGEPKNGIRSGNIDGIDVIELHLPYSNRDNFIKRSMTFLKFAFKSIDIARVTDYDLLFATSTPLTAGIPGIAMKLWKREKPFVFEVRDLWPELPREMGVITNPFILYAMSVLEWLSYHAADHCIGLSPGIVTGIQRRGIDPEKISMIPNGADLELFQPMEEKGKVPLDGIEEDDFVAIFTGAHGIANGLDAVLNAAKYLKEKGEQSIKFIFIGEGKLKASLKERTEKEGLESCLFFDAVPKLELAQLLTRADVGLMILANIPAFYYGTSPNKFFDYISSGLPVLNNYPGWLASLIKKHECGKVVEPDEPKAFAEALLEMSKSTLIDKMKKNARKLAEEHFDRKKLATQFVDLLENVFSKS